MQRELVYTCGVQEKCSNIDEIYRMKMYTSGFQTWFIALCEKDSGIYQFAKLLNMVLEAICQRRGGYEKLKYKSICKCNAD